MPELIVDLHVHSHYSRATSKYSNLEGLYYWGKLKGINIIGTGDFTHPDWFLELQEKLVPAEGGLFQLRSDIAKEIDVQLPESVRDSILRFIPAVEISTIYRKNGMVRKLHQLVVAPDFNTVQNINARLGQIGNLKADGRPILGLDVKELLRITLEASPDTLFIPAHIWTPWFGMFGSKSGFDSLEEAFEELAPHIHAIETGLSSDPAMNLQVADLNNVAITSHSDAHSPQKLGREATVVNATLSYKDIIGAFKTNDQRLVGTIEFFPQEGKYYADGHRTCGVRFTPEQTKVHGGICPVCNKPLTVGVNYRIAELASPSPHLQNNPKVTEYIIPLPEIIAELKNVKSISSKAVTEECQRLYAALGSEFAILRKIPPSHIHEQGFAALALAIEHIRIGRVAIEPGYDGVYGTIKLFQKYTH